MNGVRTASRRFLILLSALLTLPLLAPAQASPGILNASEASRLLPSAVYFAGQSSGTQLRNSAGVRFSGGALTLAVLVDNSGYSTAVQQKYQGYLLTETALQFGSHSIPPGAYGIGFLGSHFVVMDIGNHDLLRAPAVHDAQMHRPLPLQILAGSSLHDYRLCLGRSCVDFRSAHP